ncbi:hypothetical protein PpBr36_04097 [Pyricularia pennisetigena]|uniref:hypothetical protein n=1 Tax=Pyricularia pennisetigena TaxID=1578925 RepID=UPI00114E8794|nr:hypothetical protein PpBr36_04097 [Pyricularia pennisetigena]TLS27240.1 hypothetical protein PpBr36_04097 [Pyricularia pennisetigena]
MSTPTSFPGAVPPPPGVIPDLQNRVQTSGQPGHTAALVIFWFLVIIFGAGRACSKWTASPRPQLEDCSFAAASWVYITSIVCTPAAYLTKVTLLLLIARVFSVKRHVEWLIYGFVIAITLCYLSILVFKIIMCVPVAAFWDPSVRAHYRVDARKLWMAENTVNFVTNLAAMFLSISLVVPLRISLAEKVRISLLICIGSITIFASGYKLVMMSKEVSDPDLSGAAGIVNTLSMLELTVGFVCACLPPITITIERSCNKDRVFSNIPRPRLYKRIASHYEWPSAPRTTATTTTSRTGRFDYRHPRQAAISGTDADVELAVLPASRIQGASSSPATSRWLPGLDLRSYPTTADAAAAGATANRSPGIGWADSRAEDWPFQRTLMDEPEQIRSRSAGTLQQTTSWPSPKPAAMKKWRFSYTRSHRAPPSSESMGGIMRTIEITLETSDAAEPPDGNPTGDDGTGGQSSSRGMPPPLVGMTRAAAGSRSRAIHARIWDGKSHDLGTRAIGYSE